METVNYLALNGVKLYGWDFESEIWGFTAQLQINTETFPIGCGYIAFQCKNFVPPEYPLLFVDKSYIVKVYDFLIDFTLSDLQTTPVYNVYHYNIKTYDYSAKNVSPEILNWEIQVAKDPELEPIYEDWKKENEIMEM